MKNILLILFLFSLPLFSQTKEKVVATAGSEKITEKEFKARYELMPHLNKDQFNDDSLRLDFLYSLLAEKLWYQEAEKKGYAESDYIKYSILPIEKMFVRNALFEKEIGSKIKITDKDLDKARRWNTQKLKINIITSGDSSEIYSLYNQINKGASFDSLLKTRADDYKMQTEPVTVSFGDLADDKTEAVVFSLKVHEVSKPVKTNDGWYIFKLQDKTDTPPGGKDNNIFIKSKLRERKSKEIGTKYLDVLLKGQKINTDKDLFLYFSSALLNMLKQKAKDSTGYFIEESDLFALLKIIPEEKLNVPFILFDKNPNTLKEFIFYLDMNPFKVHTLSENEMNSRLLTAVQGFTRNELLTREGYRLGLDKQPDVKSDIINWKQNFMAQILRNTFIDSARVTDAEVAEHYNELYNGKKQVTQVNIIEVVSQDIDSISAFMEELNSGKDFKELAAKYPQRDWVRQRGGEFGLFPVTMFGEIGKAADKMKVGDVYGPVKVPEGFSVFKLIERKEDTSKPEAAFENVKELVKSDLVSTKLNKALNDYTVSLAEKYKVTLDEDYVKKMKLTSIEMFTHRFMGFGGRITATPYTTSLYQWYEEYKKKDNL